jgi:hypothetical protein
MSSPLCVASIYSCFVLPLRRTTLRCARDTADRHAHRRQLQTHYDTSSLYRPTSSSSSSSPAAAAAAAAKPRSFDTIDCRSTSDASMKTKPQKDLATRRNKIGPASLPSSFCSAVTGGEPRSAIKPITAQRESPVE